MAPKKLDVSFQLSYLVQSHAAENAPLDSGGLVIGKIDFADRPQQMKNFLQLGIAVGH